ncbi:receptor-like protein 9DC1 isoform X1 [Glycine max]|uniref:receptor-like protein 9DC1 isoform X1 n=1 Tax=Glycine max TaxID=3847 RepID=UPI001B355814|nr:receptor-like protein 9DC1 isoform X1 [Glycine max]
MESWMWCFLLCSHLLILYFSPSHSLCHPHDTSALLHFKNSSIIDEDPYYYSKTRTWENGTDCCSWAGVTCHPISGHVTELDLSCSGIVGYIDPNSTLFHLSHLHSLNLAFNYFDESPLSSLFGGFVSLTHLNLSNSEFEGDIPSQISHLSKLVSLDLSYNFLKLKEDTWKRLLQNATVLRVLLLNDGTDMSSVSIRTLNMSSSLVTLSLGWTWLRGNLTDGILCLPNLQHLDLSFNPALNGQLPEVSYRTTSLDFLDLSHCGFQGSIPPSFSNLTHLTSLYLSHNKLNGSIPPSFSNLTHLTSLYLSHNDLNGSIPPSFSNLTHLTSLYLSHNDLNGSIPPSFSNLTHLTSMDLSYNSLNGSVPSSLLTLPRLTFLNLDNNHLSGQIPNAFPQSNNFHELHLSYNKIEGELPSTFSNLQHLIHLDLSHNKFIGQIPDVFARLNKLNTLNLEGNNFGGPIPSSLFGSTQLSELDCSNNKLEGPLPNNITGFSSLTSLMLYGNLLNGAMPSWCLSLPSLTTLNLSGNQFTGLPGHISTISSYSLERLSLSHNKLQGNIPESIFRLVNLTDLDLSSNNFSGSVHFPLFSKLQNLKNLDLSQNNQLLLNFKSNVKYNFSRLLWRLDLSSMDLTEFPKLSGKIPFLESLHLSNNKLKGRVPNWLHEASSWLSELDLSHNQLMQSLDQFSWNQQLRYLDLSFNSITGGFSSSICNASAIQILNLSHNKLTGTIPQCLANSSSLQVLDLQLNKLHGTLPSTFAKDCRLRTLDLNGNQLLEGFLPESLSNCNDLEVLDLGNNQIKDVFPHWLQTLPELKVLVLRANKLYGPIEGSKTKHGFPSLVIFDVSSNNFSGPIPNAYIKNFQAMKKIVVLDTDRQYMKVPSNVSEYADSVTITSKAITMTMDRIRKDFVSIDLSQNRFEGKIPSVIGELHSLRGLNLSHNRLRGPIPNSMGNLTNLESLDLSSNMLTGRIPTGLTNLNFLEVLNLSNNHFVGEIPQGKQFSTFSNDSYEGNLGLCGLPLTTECSKDPKQHSPASLTFRGEQGFGFGWKPVAIGYGCGMVFGVGMGCCVLLIGKPQWIVRMVGGQLNKKVKRKTRMRSNENGSRMN